MKTTEIHYIYKITNLNPIDEEQYYIGVHTTKELKPLEDGYMGTSKFLDEAIKEQGLENFEKEILSIWSTREEAMNEEIRLHTVFDVAKNPLFYNRAKANSTGFTTHGHVTVLDTRDGKHKNVSQEDYKFFDYYKSSRDDMIMCVDLRDDNHKLVSREDYDNSEYYKFITAGKVAVKDLRDGTTKNVSQDDYEKFDYYEAFNKGKVNVKDLRDGNNKQVSKSDFDMCDYYVSVNNECVTVIDDRDGITKHVSKSDYDKYEHFVSIAKGSITVIDKNDGKTKRVSMKEFNSNDKYISGRGKKINIYNEKGELEFATWGDFKKVCKDNNLPYNVLYQAQLKGGLTIPLNKSQKSLTRFNSDGFGEDLGWSAKKVEN